MAKVVKVELVVIKIKKVLGKVFKKNEADKVMQEEKTVL